MHVAPLGFLERHCSPLVSTGQLELPCLPLIPTPPTPLPLQQPLLRFRWHRGNSKGLLLGKGENVSCCEGWEPAGQWKGQLPCSERGPDQDKQQTAGLESRVPRQSQRKETGIVGTW